MGCSPRICPFSIPPKSLPRVISDIRCPPCVFQFTLILVLFICYPILWWPYFSITISLSAFRLLQTLSFVVVIMLLNFRANYFWRSLVLAPILPVQSCYQFWRQKIPRFSSTNILVTIFLFTLFGLFISLFLAILSTFLYLFRSYYLHWKRYTY